MNTDKIKLDIKHRILIINKSFGSYTWINIYKDKLLDKEIEPLEKILKKATLRFKIDVVVAAVFMVLISFLAIRIIQEKDLVDLKKINEMLVLIPLITGAVLHTFRLYKLKTNLENKIYLIRLLDIVKED
jgi:hypothetical protein